MSEIIKIALLGIAGVLFAIQFRQQRPEYTLLIGFALSVLVFSYVLGLTGQLLEEFAGLQQYLGDAKGSRPSRKHFCSLFKLLSQSNHQTHSFLPLLSSMQVLDPSFVCPVF